MENNKIIKALEIMDERFGHDTLISLATVIENTPFVRTVDSYYENGAFYTVTYALSNKMKQIGVNPMVAVCGNWFTAHGIGENIGWILDESNADIAQKLRKAFASWYLNGHINESDINTIILKIRLTDGVLANNGTWYNVNFNTMQVK